MQQRGWTIDSGGQFDPLPVLMLQQMIADSYIDARDIWEKNRNRVRQEGDDVSSYDLPLHLVVERGPG
jgi:hypothetical protein